jgi:hypothetical protein
MLSRCFACNPLTSGLCFFVSATSEVLDDAAQLGFGDFFVFDGSEHDGYQFVLLYNALDVNWNGIPPFCRDVKATSPLPFSKQSGQLSQYF